MNIKELKNYINGADFEKILIDLYSLEKNDSTSELRRRYLETLEKAEASFSDGDYHIISSPGRAEICGNHTDHQNGVVVATALDIDNICFAKKSNTTVVTYIDELFEKKVVDIKDLSKRKDEINRAQSIIRGIAKRLTDLGYNVGGFDAYCHSKVLVGSSMSSSACFELMIVETFNTLFNEGKIDEIERAKIARWAENNYFDKPCGLMDQMAISVGNFVVIDFFDSENPKIYKKDFKFSDYGYDFYIINTKGEHTDLTEEYAAIPNEMKKIASFFGKEKLSEIDEKEFYTNIHNLRETIKNDRAVLRAHHFYTENKRTKVFNDALDKKDINKIIDIMNESGDSSYMYLQNVYPSSDVKNQGISIGLAVSKMYTCDGVVRVQGGGFAGTIEVIIKKEYSNKLVEEISKVFGTDCVLKVKTRKYGTITLL